MRARRRFNFWMNYSFDIFNISLLQKAVTTLHRKHLHFLFLVTLSPCRFSLTFQLGWLLFFHWSDEVTVNKYFRSNLMHVVYLCYEKHWNLPVQDYIYDNHQAAHKWSVDFKTTVEMHYTFLFNIAFVRGRSCMLTHALQIKALQASVFTHRSKWFIGNYHWGEN